MAAQPINSIITVDRTRACLPAAQPRASSSPLSPTQPSSPAAPLAGVPTTTGWSEKEKKTRNRRVEAKRDGPRVGHDREEIERKRERKNQKKKKAEEEERTER
jgi:hypothetical protein